MIDLRAADASAFSEPAAPIRQGPFQKCHHPIAQTTSGMSNRRAVPTTVPSWLVVPSTSPSRSLRNSSPQDGGADNAARHADTDSDQELSCLIARSRAGAR